MKPVRINQGKSFPLWSRVIIGVMSCLLIIWILKTLGYPWSIFLAILLSVVPQAFWFATKLFEIDTKNKKIFKGSWSMGFRSGQWIGFNKLNIETERVKIKPTEFSLSDNRNIITDHEYHVFLILDEEEKLYLFGHPLKERIEEKTQTLNKKLGLINSEMSPQP